MTYSTLIPDFIFPPGLLNLSSLSTVPDPGSASAGYDGIYQFSNDKCYELATSQLPLNFQAILIDGQVLSKLKAIGIQEFQPPFSNYISGATALPGNLYILLTFSPKDLLFTANNTTCIIEYNVTASLAVMVLGQPSLSGSIVGTANVNNATNAPMTPGESRAGQGQASPGSAPNGVPANYAGFQIFTLPNGATSTAYILSYLATGILRLPGIYGVNINATNATIDAVSNLTLPQLGFANTSGQTPIILSNTDPVGLLVTLRASLKPYQTVFLMPEICPLGLNAGSNSVFTTFEAQVFPTGLPVAETPSSLTVALTVSPTLGNPADVPDLVANSDYAIVGSEQVLSGLVNQRWLIGSFPTSVPSSGPIQVVLNGQVTNAVVSGSFNFATLDGVGIDFDSNARADIIMIWGTGQEFPTTLTLSNGTVVSPSGPDDPNFQPSPTSGWLLSGPLVESLSNVPNVGPLYQQVTSDATVYLGRPFTGSINATVTNVAISAPSQRILLLCTITGGLTTASI